MYATLHVCICMCVCVYTVNTREAKQIYVPYWKYSRAAAADACRWEHVSTCKNKGGGGEGDGGCKIIVSAFFLFSLPQAMCTNNDQFQVKLLTQDKTRLSDHATRSYTLSSQYLLSNTNACLTHALLRYKHHEPWLHVSRRLHL